MLSGIILVTGLLSGLKVWLGDSVAKMCSDVWSLYGSFFKSLDYILLWTYKIYNYNINFNFVVQKKFMANSVLL